MIDATIFAKAAPTADDILNALPELVDAIAVPCANTCAALSMLIAAAKKDDGKSAINAILESRDALSALLMADKPKTRKNAARLLGALGNKQDAAPLIAALNAEKTRMVRPSMILALGSVGGGEAADYLKAHVVPPPQSDDDKKHFSEEADALTVALSKVCPHAPHKLTGFNCETEFTLRAPDGFAKELFDELLDLGYSPFAKSSDRLTVKTDDFAGLYDARCFTEVLIPLFIGLPARPGALAGMGGKIVAIMDSAHQGGGEYTYRIELRSCESVDRGAFIHECAKAVDDQRLINSPSRYELELRLEMRGAVMDGYLKLFTFVDHRFDYRKNALPASINPATAACILRHCEEHLKVNARVLDPCCGSGTMLIERAMLSPCAALTGVDIAHKAIDIARVNALAAGKRAKFIVNDCARFTANRPYDEVIVNLPFGNRVGTHKSNEELYDTIIKSLPVWMPKGGVALLYTMEMTLMKKLLAKDPRLTLIEKTRISAGGLLPYLFVVKV